MTESAASDAYVWQTRLNPQNTDDPVYHNYLNAHLTELFVHPPRLMLDIGCASGVFGAFVKEKYPDARVIGAELNRAAADAARGKLDLVLQGRFEELDLSAAGIPPGSIDTVIAADILEHLYDPWQVMVGLKKFLTPDAQVIASIPNVRNLGLLSELVNEGSWRYANSGLLDVTHIRFFTQREVIRFFDETGYQVRRIDPAVATDMRQVYDAHVNQPNITLQVGRLVIQDLSKQELLEFCTHQLFVRAEPRP